MLKQAENEALAWRARARPTMRSSRCCGTLKGRMYLGVMAASKLEEPTAHPALEQG